jgi:hypothetical protein
VVADEPRAARREFIRTHHPDRGGDLDQFVAGLQRFDVEAAAGAAPVMFVRRPRGIRRIRISVRRAVRLVRRIPTPTRVR